MLVVPSPRRSRQRALYAETPTEGYREAVLLSACVDLEGEARQIGRESPFLKFEKSNP